MIKTPHGHNRYSAISSLLPDGAEKGGCAARSLDRAFKVVPAPEELEVDRIFFSRPPSHVYNLYMTRSPLAWGPKVNSLRHNMSHPNSHSQAVRRVWFGGGRVAESDHSCIIQSA